MLAEMLRGRGVKSILVELEDGEMVFLDMKKTMALPAPETATEPVVEETEPPVAVVVEEEPMIEAEATVVDTVEKKPFRRRRGGRKASGKPTGKLAICVPLHECMGAASYEGSRGWFDVAIYDSGTKRNGERWYKLLFVSKDKDWAFHSTLRGGFTGNPDKMKDITWF